MNLIGKIFTVGIFLGSIGFLAFAIFVVTNDHNWRDVAIGPEGLKPQVETIIATNKQLTEQLEQLKANNRRERATRTTIVAALNNALLDESADLEKKQEDLVELVGLHGTEVEKLRQAQFALEESTRILNKMLAQTKENKLDRDQKLAEASKLLDQVAAASGETNKQQKTEEWIVEDKIQMQNVLASLGLTEESDVSHIPVRLKSRITAISQVDENLFEIEVGYDDGLRPNAIMEIYRNNEYIGRAIVIRTKRNVAAMQVIPESLQQNLQVGDQVATVLGSNDLKKLDIIRRSRVDLSPSS